MTLPRIGSVRLWSWWTDRASRHDRAVCRHTIFYFGDTARLPYGTKSAETVARYAIRCNAIS